MNKKRLEEKLRKIKKMKQDRRYLDVVGFLAHKGLLITNREYEYKNEIGIKDALWAAKLEPRIMETLPAAFLHFPKSIKDEHNMPKSLQAILEDILNGVEDGPDYKGVKYSDMRRWANMRLKDGRTKPVDQKKRQTNFRLSPKVLHNLERFATNKNLSKTEALEELIMKWGG